VGACWDADRFNLWRVGIEPDPRYLSTPAARDHFEELSTRAHRRIREPESSWSAVAATMEGSL